MAINVNVQYNDGFLLDIILTLYFIFIFLRTSSARGGGGAAILFFSSFFSLFSRPRAGLATV